MWIYSFANFLPPTSLSFYNKSSTSEVSTHPSQKFLFQVEVLFPLAFSWPAAEVKVAIPRMSSFHGPGGLETLPRAKRALGTIGRCKVMAPHTLWAKGGKNRI